MEENKEQPNKRMEVLTGVHSEGEAKIMKKVAEQMGLTFLETPAGNRFEVTHLGRKSTFVTIKPNEVGVRIEYPVGPNKDLTEFWKAVEKAKQGK